MYLRTPVKQRRLSWSASPARSKEPANILPCLTYCTDSILLPDLKKNLIIYIPARVQRYNNKSYSFIHRDSGDFHYNVHFIKFFSSNVPPQMMK